MSQAAPKPSLLSTIFGGKPTDCGPMDQPMAGVAVPEAPVAPAAPPATRVTTLANGAKIASENTLGGSMAVGLYIGAGSKNEIPYTVGAAHMLERMAFRATANRTSFRFTREAEVIGANLLASASREQMAYTVDCLKTNLPEAVELLADAVMNPKLADHEVAEVAAALKAEMTALAANPANLMMEAVHAVAYSGGLGQPLIATPAALSRVDGDALAHFIAANYTAPNVVLAASGVAHEDLVAVAEPLLSQLPAGPSAGARPSAYVGGDYRVATDSPHTSIVLAFEFAGGWKAGTTGARGCGRRERGFVGGCGYSFTPLRFTAPPHFNSPLHFPPRFVPFQLPTSLPRALSAGVWRAEWRVEHGIHLHTYSHTNMHAPRNELCAP